MSDQLIALLEKIRRIRTQLQIVEVKFMDFIDTMMVFEQEMEELQALIYSIAPETPARPHVVSQPRNNNDS